MPNCQSFTMTIRSFVHKSATSLVHTGADKSFSTALSWPMSNPHRFYWVATLMLMHHVCLAFSSSSPASLPSTGEKRKSEIRGVLHAASPPAEPPEPETPFPALVLVREDEDVKGAGMGTGTNGQILCGEPLAWLRAGKKGLDK